MTEIAEQKMMEEIRKVTRIEKAERGRKERKVSEGNVEKLWKRRKEMMEVDGGEAERVEIWAFREEKKVQRSPERRKGRREREKK